MVNILILDLTLPGMDGLDVCKEISSKYDIPIIISSARSDLSDKIIVSSTQSLSDSYIRSLDVIIGRLRTKLNDNTKNPSYLISVRGLGYKLNQ